MTTLSKRIIVLLCVTAPLVTAGLGWNTALDFGKDMSAAGPGNQNGTK